MVCSQLRQLGLTYHIALKTSVRQRVSVDDPVVLWRVFFIYNASTCGRNFRLQREFSGRLSGSVVVVRHHILIVVVDRCPRMCFINVITRTYLYTCIESVALNRLSSCVNRGTIDSVGDCKTNK